MPFLRTIAALFTMALAGALAVPAQAGPVGKPTVVEFSQCDEIGPDAVLCVQARIVTKTVETPSGNRNLRTKSTITSQFTSAGCRQEEHQERFERTLTRGLKDQVATTKDHLRIVGTCFDPGGPVMECVQTIKYRLANGEVRVDRFDFTCQPVP